VAEALITEEDYHRFREYFYRRTGIQLGPDKRYYADKRLLERIRATGSKRFKDYFLLLRYEPGDQEFQNLTNLMTVNETFFFREEYQFQCLVDSILPERVRAKPPGSTIRIWSIPSSSGEEAYSIALYLTERWPGIDQWEVELVSSDIDTAVLDQARAGIFSARSVHKLPGALLQAHFQPLPGERYLISEGLRQSVEFTRVNLLDPKETRAYRGFDVVFCRNLLIYFDDRSRTAAAEALYDALLPGGFICLGHSESMSRITPLFGVRKFPEAIVYQKPELP
jgi:chemotaxis protein methyltransferase CheR